MSTHPEHLKNQVQKDQILLSAIQTNLPQLESLFMPFQTLYEDGVYRFYHHSFKVYLGRDFRAL